MSLKYGFGWGEPDDGVEEWRKERYEDLDEDEQKFYHNALPFLLMAEDIGYVSEGTIPEIVKRHKLNPIVAEKGGQGDYIDDEELESILQSFLGFEANVTTEPDQKFLQKLRRIGHLELTPKKIEKDYKEYLQEIYDVGEEEAKESAEYVSGRK